MTGHIHPHTDSKQNLKRLALSLGITLVFVVIEALAGWYSNSLALLSDAGHNLTDVIALGISFFALQLSIRPSNGKRTYGYHRAGILAALVNSTTLVVIAIWIFYEAVKRLRNPEAIDSYVLVGVGLVALAVNLVTAWLVHRGSQHDLNMRSAFIHLMGDVFSTAGALIAGVMILFTDWYWLDPLVSLLIGGLILWNAWLILRESVDILLESTPADIDMEQLVSDLNGIDGVQGVHDLHVWSITKSMRNLSAHIVVEDMALSEGTSIRLEIDDLLAHKYYITHATLQFECATCNGGVLFCQMAG